MKRSLPAATMLVAIMFALSACNSTETLGSAAQGTAAAPGSSDIAPPASGQGAAPAAAAALPAPTAAPPAAPAAAGPTPDGQVAALASTARVQLAPVVGTSIDAAAPLSRRLETRGREKGIDFRGEGAQRLAYVLKGYFSLETGERSGTIYYVWDVLDTAGNRLHRISGQQQVAGRVSSDWSGVDGGSMEAVADRTIDELARWMASRQG